MNEIQSILPCLSHDDATINVFLKWHFEYKSPYISKTFPSNMMIINLRNLIKTPLYKDLNVIIHHQWANLFTLHMDLESQIFYFSDALSNNFDSNSEELHCTSIDLMIHNFLEAPKIMDYENTIYSITKNQHFHLLSLSKDKHLKKLNFPALFYGQPWQFLQGFIYQQIT